MDIGINYLGDPWGFHALGREDRIELLAYWHLHHRETQARWLLSTPASLADLYAMLKMSKGKTPRGLFEAQPQHLDPATSRQWQKRTGSSGGAISWWLKG